MKKIKHSFETRKTLKHNFQRLASLGMVAFLSFLAMKTEAKTDTQKIDSSNTLKLETISDYSRTLNDGLFEIDYKTQDLEGGGDDTKIEAKADNNTKITFTKNSTQQNIKITYKDTERNFPISFNEGIINNVKFDKKEVKKEKVYLSSYKVGEPDHIIRLTETYYFKLILNDSRILVFAFDVIDGEKVENEGIE